MHYPAAEKLEQYLGDPLNPAHVLSFKRAIELDEVEAYPEEACALLDKGNYQLYYVPAEYGGKLESYEELYSLIRVISRRDMTVGLTHATSYAASSVIWTAGSEHLRRELANSIAATDQIAIGLHEKEHGNDLLGCEFLAEPIDGGFNLSGEKWVLSNPRRARTVVVFARTSPEGGPRGFSLLLTNKRSLPEHEYAHLKKFKTHGVRSHEVSGIRFHDCFVPDSNLIGNAGAGLEIALKSSQITRTIFTATCLGAADTAFRTTIDFARSRRLYGGAVIDIAYPQRLLVDTFLDLLICDCVATAGTRALHVAPEQMSVWSPVVKYFIPTTVETLLQNLSAVLGARYYLREGHWHGIFQKIVRDAAFSGVTHYSSVINLSHLAPQLQQLAKANAKKQTEIDEARDARLKNIFSLGQPLSVFDATRLSLSNHGQDDVFAGLEKAVAHLRGVQGIAALDELIELGDALFDEIEIGNRALAELVSRDGYSFSNAPEAFELARRYITLHAAASCLYLWLHNRNELGDYFARGEWLALCLNKLLTIFQPWRPIPSPDFYKSAAQEIVRLYEEDQLFSLIPLQLARTESFTQ